MTPQERQARADWLATLGVPGHFRDAIIDAPNTQLTSRGGTALGLAMVAVTIAIMVATFLKPNNRMSGPKPTFTCVREAPVCNATAAARACT